jgi:RND family efflux transporter MFP subunit
MTRRKLSEVVRYLQQLANPERASGLSDAELLERYVRHRDEAAFELLLWRHGVLVFNVCHRILPREQDAEDAFQATFLAFVRKAHAIARRGSVASWLFKVAYRVALEARERARKTAARERPGGETLAVQPSADPIWEDVRSILDEELNHLPERLRRPFILCYLEGKTNDEAARLLGCRPGTIFSRLARGRELLRNRLVRRGVTLSTAMLTAALGRHAAEAVPTALLRATALRTALSYASGPVVSGISIQVTTLAEGVLRTMFLTKLKMTALVLCVVGLLAAGGVLTQHALKAAAQPEAQTEEPPDLPEIARKNDEKKTAVRVVRPRPGGLERTSRYSGHARAAAQQQVYSVIPGFLKQLLVDIGSRVKKGDVLVEIDAPLLVKDAEQAAVALQQTKGQYMEAKARVVTAEAELRAAEGRIKEIEVKLKSDKAHLAFRKRQLERYKQLLAARSIDTRLVDEQEDQHEAAVQAVAASEQALVSARSAIAVKESQIESAKAALTSAEASVRMAQIALDKARLKVDFTHIRANFDGVVTRRNFDAGDFVSAGDQGASRSLLTVQRIDTMRVAVNVTEAEAAFIRPGIPVELRINSPPDVKLPVCKVSRTGFAIDERTGTMPVEIDVPNPQNLLRPGMYIWATIHLDKKAPVGAVTVPASSVVTREGREYVYVVCGGKAQLTPVQVSYSGGDRLEISSGVQADDRIVADPHGLKGETVPVEVEKTPR